MVDWWEELAFKHEEEVWVAEAMLGVAGRHHDERIGHMYAVTTRGGGGGGLKEYHCY